MPLETTSYAPETDDANEAIYRKLREHFDGIIFGDAVIQVITQFSSESVESSPF